MAAWCVIAPLIDGFPAGLSLIGARSARIIVGVLLALIVAQRMTC
jgi:hypothetical protein